MERFSAWLRRHPLLVDGTLAVILLVETGLITPQGGATGPTPG